MTVLVGIKCKDGIVVGSDSSATFTAGQIRTIEQTTKKIQVLHGKLIVAGTGQIGLGQRFCDVVNRGYTDGQFKSKNAIQMASQMTTLAVQNFGSTGAQQGQFGALVAYAADHDIHLCEFATQDFQPELKTDSIWYASMGSGQLIADPFLGLMRSVFWKSGMPTLQDGIFIATWAIQHAIDVNTGGVGGAIQMAILTNEKSGPVARMLSDDELTEHRENVSGAIAHLGNYGKQLAGTQNGNVPDLPSPPAQA